MNSRQCFIYNLKKYRGAAGLSQMQLAELCDTATNYISEIEVGKKFPSVEMIDRIAGALRIQPYLLFFNERQRPDRQAPLIAQKIKTDILQQLLESAQKVLRQY